MQQSQQLLNQHISASTTCRQVKIAYLIANNEHAHKNLDHIFADAYARWGGRYTLIIPIKNGKIDGEEYWRWLTNFDPDIIYTSGHVNKELIKNIERFICPMRFEEIKYMFHNDWLSSLSTLLFLKEKNDYLNLTPKKIINISPRIQNNRFLLDNFGSTLNVPQINKHLDILHVTNAGDDKPKFTGKILIGENELLNELSHHNDIISLRDLSSFDAEIIKDASHPWSSTLNLFVGDDFIERISFWNSYLSDSTSENYRKYSIIIPKKLIRDEVFLESLGKYIKAIFRKLNQYLLHIRSNSLKQKSAEDLIDKLEKYTGLKNSFKFEKINNITDCAQRKNYQFQSYFNNQSEHYQMINNTKFLLNFNNPNFLSKTINPEIFNKQNFIISLRLERHNNYSGVFDSSQTWLLPTRYNLSKLFFRDRDSESDTRISKNGLLCVKATIEKNNKIPVTLPYNNSMFAGDEMIFSTLLYNANRFYMKDLRSRLKYKRYSHAVSEKGRYLIQIFNLFGGINNTFRYMSNKFLREYFEAYSHIQLNDNVAKKIGKTIKKIKNSSNETIYKYLENLIFKSAKDVKLPKKFFIFDDIRNKYKNYLKNIINSSVGDSIIDKKSFMKTYSSDMEKCIKNLLMQEVIYQGYNIKCSHCGNKNWITVDTLSTINKCQICQYYLNTPIASPWEFFLNHNLCTAIREHGIIPQILVLALLCEQASNSFYFMPPTDIYKRENKKQIATDIDLFCVRDGKLLIGEIKSSARENVNLDKLVDISLMLRADEIVLAFYEKRSKKSDDLFKDLTDSLHGKNIEASLITLEDFDNLRYNFLLPK